MVLFKGFGDDFARGREGKFARGRRPFGLKFGLDDAFDFVVQPLPFFFLFALRLAQAAFLRFERIHQLGTRLPVAAQFVPGHLGLGQRRFNGFAFFGQRHANAGQFGLGLLDLCHLVFARFGIGLDQPESHDGLGEVVGRKHKHPRVGRQLHAVRLLDHAGVFLLEGRDVAFKGANFRVGAVHGPLQRADGGFVVVDEFLAQLDLLVQQRHLGGRVVAVAARLLEQVFRGGELLGQPVPLALQRGFVARLGPNQGWQPHSCNGRHNAQRAPPINDPTRCAAQNFREW